MICELYDKKDVHLNPNQLFEYRLNHVQKCIKIT